MKKLILIILTLIIFSLFTSQTFACSNQSTVTTTIDYVYYDSNDQTYYAVTTEDTSQGRWIVSLESLTVNDTNTLDNLNKAYKGKQILIKFIGDITTDEDIEIVSSELIQQ
jgi:hypothetical protein